MYMFYKVSFTQKYIIILIHFECLLTCILIYILDLKIEYYFLVLLNCFLTVPSLYKVYSSVPSVFMYSYNLSEISTLSPFLQSKYQCGICVVYRRPDLYMNFCELRKLVSSTNRAKMIILICSIQYFKIKKKETNYELSYFKHNLWCTSGIRIVGMGSWEK